MEKSATPFRASLPQDGVLLSAWVTDLLIDAFQSRFDGTLFINTPKGERVAIRIEQGYWTRWHSEEGRQVVLRSLADLLPPEQIDFVSQHALNQGVDELSSIAELHLLPESALDALHHQCSAEELCALAADGPALHYRFAAGHDCFEGQPGWSAHIHPVSLLVESLSKQADVDWLRKRLQPIRYERLSIVQDERHKLTGPMHPSLRQVLRALERQSESLDALRLRRVLPEGGLLVTVYALWITGHLIVQGTTSAAIGSTGTNPTSRSSYPPQATASSSGLHRIDLAETPAPGTALPGALSTPPTSGGRAGRAPDEHTAESAAMDAWMRAVADPSCAERALKIAERAAELYPQNPRILFYYGCLTANSGKLDEGESLIRRVLQLDPEHTEAQHELELVQKAKARSQTRPALFDRLGRRSG